MHSWRMLGPERELKRSSGARCAAGAVMHARPLDSPSAALHASRPRRAVQQGTRASNSRIIHIVTSVRMRCALAVRNRDRASEDERGHPRLRKALGPIALSMFGLVGGAFFARNPDVIPLLDPDNSPHVYRGWVVASPG